MTVRTDGLDAQFNRAVYSTKSYSDESEEQRNESFRWSMGLRDRGWISSSIFLRIDPDYGVKRLRRKLPSGLP